MHHFPLSSPLLSIGCAVFEFPHGDILMYKRQFTTLCTPARSRAQAPFYSVPLQRRIDRSKMKSDVTLVRPHMHES